MQAEEDYERDYIMAIGGGRTNCEREADGYGRGWTPKGACARRTARCGRVAKLKARNAAGMFRAVEQNISDQDEEDWERFQGQAPGQSCSTKNAAEERRRKEAEAEGRLDRWPRKRKEIG